MTTHINRRSNDSVVVVVVVVVVARRRRIVRVATVFIVCHGNCVRPRSRPRPRSRRRRRSPPPSRRRRGRRPNSVAGSPSRRCGRQLPWWQLQPSSSQQWPQAEQQWGANSRPGRTEFATCSRSLVIASHNDGKQLSFFPVFFPPLPPAASSSSSLSSSSSSSSSPP